MTIPMTNHLPNGMIWNQNYRLEITHVGSRARTGFSRPRERLVLADDSFVSLHALEGYYCCMYVHLTLPTSLMMLWFILVSQSMWHNFDNRISGRRALTYAHWYLVIMVSAGQCATQGLESLRYATISQWISRI